MVWTEGIIYKNTAKLDKDAEMVNLMFVKIPSFGQCSPGNGCC